VLLFVLKKVLQLVFVLLVVSFLTFLMLDQLEGDVVDVRCGLGCTPEQRDELRVEYGLDQPIPVQYGKWLQNLVVDRDLGASGVNGVPVSESLGDKLPVTLFLVVYSQFIALGIGLLLGTASARKPAGRVDRISSVIAGLAISVPNYVFAFIVILLFAVTFPIFKVTATNVNIEVLLPDVGAQLSNFGNNLYLLLLPAICLALAELAVYARLLRNDLIATLQEDYVTMARAKGLPARQIMWRHAFRPSTFSLATVAGINMGRLIGGTIIVEAIFAINGMGLYVVQSINQRDSVPLQGAVLVIATAYVLINFAVDLLYAFLDPRIRDARATA
jgi:peptide/nickel transport system permease protein